MGMGAKKYNKNCLPINARRRGEKHLKVIQKREVYHVDRISRESRVESCII